MARATALTAQGTTMALASMREAVGVFGDEKSLRAAADELMISGFDRADLSILSRQKKVEQRLGHSYEKVSELEDEPNVATRAYIGSDSLIEAKSVIVMIPCFIGAVGAAGAVTASGGTTLETLIWAGIAGIGGALVGGIFAGIVAGRQRDYLDEQLDHGGIPLWVRTVDAEHEKRACEILERTDASDIHVHDHPIDD